MRTMLLTCLLLLFQATDAFAELRYRLEPGMELTYVGESSSTRPDGSKDAGSTSRTVYTVADQRSDGSWLVYAYSRVELRLGGLNGPMVRASAGRFTLTPAGEARLDGPPPAGTADLTASFIPLPTAAELDAGEWRRDAAEVTRAMKLDRPLVDGTPVVIHVTPTDPIDAIYDVSKTSTITFDPAQGLITLVETRLRQGWGVETTSEGTVRLDAVRRLSPEELARAVSEYQICISATDAYAATVEGAAKSPDPAKAMADARNALDAAGKRLEGSPLHPVLAEQLKQHEQMAQYTLSELAERAKRIGQPSPEWILTGYDGKEHKLADYRGKVVLLDFWYRGCGWCIKAMPALNAVAEKFEGRPVQLLGMNTDRNEGDARLVMEKMSLAYPTLKAQEMPERYGVSAFPTLIVIDAEGKIADIHVGYSPDLEEKLTAQIQSMLGTAAATR